VYATQEFNVRLRWMEVSPPGPPPPMPARAEVEVGQLLPQALIRIRAYPPEESGIVDLEYVIRINPSFHGAGSNARWLFEVWLSLEDQGWITGEFDWDDSSIDYDRVPGEGEPLDDLNDALYNGDEKAVFDAFSRLPGGQIEFVNWLEPPSLTEHDTGHD
jgi:hypothetical protein